MCIRQHRNEERAAIGSFHILDHDLQERDGTGGTEGSTVQGLVLVRCIDDKRR